MNMTVQAVEQTTAIIKYTNVFLCCIVNDLRHREAFMTSGAFCISYFYMNLSKKQISIYVAKTERY